MNKEFIDFEKEYLKLKNNINLLNKKSKDLEKLNKKFKRLELFFFLYAIITISIFILIEHNFNNLSSFIHDIFQQRYTITPNYYFNESNFTEINFSR